MALYLPHRQSVWPHFFSTFDEPLRFNIRQGNGEFEPTYSYVQSEKGTIIQVELPGVSKEDLALDVKERKLTLRAKRFSREISEEKAGPTSDAKPEVIFSKTFNLPDSADVDAITADYRDGLLKIVIGKGAMTEKRSIKVN